MLSTNLGTWNRGTWEALRRLREVDLRCLRCGRRRFEERVVFEAEHLRGEVAGELTPRRVVFLYALVVPHPLRRDAILGPREFVHQRVELLVRFQVRVILDDEQE